MPESTPQRTNAALPGEDFVIQLPDFVLASMKDEGVPSYKILGLGTEQPLLSWNGQVFSGEWLSIIGTNVAYARSEPSDLFEYASHSTKILRFDTAVCIPR